jgi:hypothetical protein
MSAADNVREEAATSTVANIRNIIIVSVIFSGKKCRRFNAAAFCV